MENAVDALKMAGAAMLFILAFTLSMMMFAKAKDTTDAILDNLRLKDFFPKVESLPNSTTREVGIETIIPTLYRYCQSDTSLRVRIVTAKFDARGKLVEEEELQVFDTGIEAIVGREDITDPYQAYIKSKYNEPSKKAYMFEAPWANQNQEAYRLERVNAYINGTKTIHMPKVDYSQTMYGGNLMKYSDRTFYESYLEYSTSGKVFRDNYGEEIVRIPANTKIVITYSLPIS